MGVRITADEKKVALFCSVTGFAFGPVFDAAVEAEDFLDHVRRVAGCDPRQLSEAELRVLHGGWVALQEAA